MPYVNIPTYKGDFYAHEKRAPQEKITDLLILYEGKGSPESQKPVWVKLQKENIENCMVGGQNIKDRLDANSQFKENYLRNLNEKTT